MKKLLFLMLILLIILSCELKNPTVQNDENNKPIVVLAFDSGYQNTYEIALPILKRFGFSATVGMVTAKIGLDGYLSMNELQSLQNDYGWEIASESYSGDDLESLYDQEFRQELSESKEMLTDNGLEVNTFIVPFGNISVRQEPIVMEYYQNILIPYTDNYNKSPLLRYSLWTYEITDSLSVQDVEDRINQAINIQEKILIFHFHKITYDNNDAKDITPEFFNSILEVLKEGDYKVLPLNLALSEILGGSEYEK